MRDSNCDKCTLNVGCSSVCTMAYSVEEADMLVVLDYPTKKVASTGNIEDDYRLSFLKEILDDVIGYAGTLHPTYMSKCRPLSGRPAEIDEAELCINTYMTEEMAVVKPKAILGFGEAFLNLFAEASGVGRNSGEVYYLNDIPVIGTYSPAFVKTKGEEPLLRQFAEACLKATNFALDVDGKETPTIFKTVNTLAEVDELIDYIIATGDCCFDVETTGLNYLVDTITVLGITFQQGSGWAIPWRHAESPFSDEDLQYIVMQFNERVFKSLAITKFAHNMKFDIKFCKMEGFEFGGRMFDTMLMHHLLDENTRHGLKEIAAVYYPNHTGYDDEVKKFKWDSVPMKILAPYCVSDTDLTLRLGHFFLDKLLEEPDLYRIFRNITTPGMLLTCECEQIGMQVDRDFLESAIIEVQGMIADLDIEMRKVPQVAKFDKDKRVDTNARVVADLTQKLLRFRQKKKNKDQVYKTETNYETKIANIKSGALQVYEPINFASTNQLAELLYGPDGFRFSMPYVKKKRDFHPATGKDYISEFDHPFIDMLIQSRVYKKCLSTYLIGIRDRLDSNNVVHPSFLIHGTVTGRLSSRDPNMQNIPRGGGTVYDKVKAMFNAPAGHKVVQVDYSQAELRIVAHLSGDKAMTEVYANDGDIHTLTAQKVMGVSEAEWEELSKDARKKFRTNAKAVNFGFVYGMGAKSFVEYAKVTYGIILTLDEAEVMRHAYFKLYRSLKQWHRVYMQLAHERGYVRTLFGRKRRLPELKSHLDNKVADAERQSINSPVQGTGGEFTLFAGAIYRQRKPDRVKMVNTVHDSWIFYIPEETLIEDIRLIMDTFEDPLTMEYFGFNMGELTMKVDAEAGDTWATLDEIPRENIYN